MIIYQMTFYSQVRSVNPREAELDVSSLRAESILNDPCIISPSVKIMVAGGKHNLLFPSLVTLSFSRTNEGVTTALAER